MIVSCISVDTSWYNWTVNPRVHKNRKAISVLGLIFLLFVLLSVWEQVKEPLIISELESKVLPFAQENSIQNFFDREWCKTITYGLPEISLPKCIPGVGPAAQAPGHPAWVKFFETRKVLKSVLSEDFEFIRHEYERTTHREIGLAFHVECFFCRVRYVYWPNYTSLPADQPYEIYYTPINSDWYRVDEDWN